MEYVIGNRFVHLNQTVLYIISFLQRKENRSDIFRYKQGTQDIIFKRKPFLSQHQYYKFTSKTTKDWSLLWPDSNISVVKNWLVNFNVSKTKRVLSDPELIPIPMKDVPLDKLSVLGAYWDLKSTQNSSRTHIHDPSIKILDKWSASCTALVRTIKPRAPTTTAIVERRNTFLKFGCPCVLIDFWRL